MSFPRKVPLAKKKINYTLRNRLLGGGLAYAFGFGAVAMHYGFFDKVLFEEFKPGSEAEKQVRKTQLEDEESWIKWSFRLADSSSLKAKQMIHEHFVDKLPVGLQHYINDPRYQLDYPKKKALGLIKEEDGKIIEIYDSAPGLSPTKVKADDLVVITSSKKKEEP